MTIDDILHQKTIVLIDNLIRVYLLNSNNKMCVIPPLTILLCISTHMNKTFSKWNFEKYLICIIKEFFMSFLLLNEEN